MFRSLNIITNTVSILHMVVYVLYFAIRYGHRAQAKITSLGYRVVKSFETRSRDDKSELSREETRRTRADSHEYFMGSCRIRCYLTRIRISRVSILI